MNNLIRIAGCSAIGVAIVSGYTILINHSFYKRVRDSVTYKRALEKVHNHKETVEHLGEPIVEGKISYTYTDVYDTLRDFSVKLKGSKTEGILDCQFYINEDAKTELKKLNIRFKDLPNQMFVIHESQ